MKIPEFCQALEAALAAQADGEARLHLACTALQQAFKVRADEVAIFRLEQESRDLCFLWPKKLARSGRIPLVTRDSLLARTAREGQAHLDNRFATTRHVSVFEAVPLGDAKEKAIMAPLPIQKIMSAPIFEGDQVCGVVQVSRKGLDPESAGADFTAGELDALVRIVKAVGRYLLP